LAEQRLEDDEILTVQPTPFDKAIEMIKTGEIQDAKTIVGLLLTSMRQ
ncbi:MAG: ADP-ribose pyrophosphatase, partial [Deltaproteobacteria bacterium]|nr:ADP-ribose pyrophosphatase [Deltaproteobacteria bacterium]